MCSLLIWGNYSFDSLLAEIVKDLGICINFIFIFKQLNAFLFNGEQMGWLGIQRCLCNWSLGGPSVQAVGQMARLPNPFLGPIASSAGRPGRTLKGFQHINITRSEKTWTTEGLQLDMMCCTTQFKGRYKWFSGRYPCSVTLWRFRLSPSVIIWWLGRERAFIFIAKHQARAEDFWNHHSHSIKCLVLWPHQLFTG